MIVTVVTADTPSVVIGKLTFVAPLGIETVAGTVAAVVSELEREMTMPEGPAAPLSFTVPVEDTPALTVVGANAKLRSHACRSVRVQVLGVPP